MKIKFKDMFFVMLLGAAIMWATQLFVDYLLVYILDIPLLGTVIGMGLDLLGLPFISFFMAALVYIIAIKFKVLIF